MAEAPKVPPPMPDLGTRADGTPKGWGFFGPIDMADGRSFMTELSSGFEIDGAETEIPILVPTLSFDDIEHLKNGGAITPEIARKAYAFAMQRKANGLPYFAEPGEYYSLPAPPLPPLPPLKE